ncbi:hypothetical protein N9C16_09910 [Paracoccaceae bacterium]|nr:hypothetical protein [Paracoccaceae bacterium]
MLTIASQAGAECGNLCDYEWVRTATPADVQAELDGGADVMARDEDGFTPLHGAAQYGSSANIQPLLDAGADAKAKNKEGKTPWDYAQNNKDLKGTKGYWALNDAQYN